jgi:MFS family permease
VPGSAIVLLVSICLSNFLGAVAAPAWLSWLADIIPEDQHASFWGRRSSWVSLFTVAVFLAAGLVADTVPEDQRINATVAIFVAAGGVGSTAATIAANKLITRFPPPEARTMYIAISTSLANLAGGLGPIIAGTVLRSVGDRSVFVGGFELTAFRMLFVASVLLRLTSVLVFIPRIARQHAQA